MDLTTIEFVMNVIFVASMVILNFVIFKVPVKSNDKQIAFIALVVGFVNYYFKFVSINNNYLLIQTIVYIVVVMLIRRYPFFYAFILGVTGTIAVALIDTLLTIAALRTNLSSMELMTTNTLHFTAMHLLTSSVMLVLAAILHKFGIGFSFIRSRFSGKYSFNAINFVWGIVLTLGVLSLIYSTRSFETYSLHFYIIGFMGLCMISSIVYAWAQNKKHVKSRRGDNK